ncbi:unnamed protein product [Dibothriocephalus latus]|uniref:Uncharacterized protein n=1 Tax=Dibothriocephalus latus TaxID=60516 RepID=A0A3P6TAZ2_DIBLA|nr:unnamed protein product [Dibothriocephalus latus]
MHYEIDILVITPERYTVRRTHDCEVGIPIGTTPNVDYREQCITEERFDNFFAQGERISNNRPLGAPASNSNDLGPLTPNSSVWRRNCGELPSTV